MSKKNQSNNSNNIQTSPPSPSPPPLLPPPPPSTTSNNIKKRKFNDTKSVIIRLLKEVNSSNYEKTTDKIFVLLSDTSYTKQPRNVIKGGIDIISKEICMKKEVEIEAVKEKEAEDKLFEYYQSCALILVRLIEKFKNVKVKKGKALINGNDFVKNYLVNWVKDTFYKLVSFNSSNSNNSSININNSKGKGNTGIGSFIKSNKLISVCCFIGELYLFNIITPKVLNTFVEKLINYNYYNNNNDDDDSNSSSSNNSNNNNNKLLKGLNNLLKIVSPNFIQSNNTKTYLTNYYRKLESLLNNNKISNENKMIIKETIEHLDGLLLLSSSTKNQNDKTKKKKVSNGNNITKVVTVAEDHVDKKVDELNDTKLEMLEISPANDLTANDDLATDATTSSDQTNEPVEITNSDEEESSDDEDLDSDIVIVNNEDFESPDEGEDYDFV